MEIFNYSEAKKHFAEILDTAKVGNVLVKRQGGSVFTLKNKNVSTFSFAVPCIQTKATTIDILQAVKDSRSR